MRIIVDDNIPFIRGRLEAVADVVYTDQWGFTPELVRDADAVVIRTRTRCNGALLGGSRVSLVATATIGTDQIDTEWCAKAGITVRNAPGCNAPGVAQYVWSSLLRLGFDPGRHTLGIIGCGNVGGVVREWGERLGVRILVNDPPKEKLGVADTYTDLETLLAESDAVTLHTPLTLHGNHATHHLIGESRLGLMRDGAILVNAARGPVVDTSALRRHADRLRLVIDTWEEEPLTDAEILRKCEYGTFHIAGYSHEGKQRATRMVLEAIEDHFGVQTDKSGLTPAYQGAPGITAGRILESYDPADDTAPLRRNPEAFDTLRRNYDFRHEPPFN